MFEAVFRITALVKSDGQGQRIFLVTEREAPANDAEFLSRLATMYQQEVYAALRVGDDLTVAVRLDLPPSLCSLRYLSRLEVRVPGQAACEWCIAPPKSYSAACSSSGQVILVTRY